MYACWRIKTKGHEFEDSNGNQIYTIHLRFWCPIADNLTWCIKGCEKWFNKNGGVSIVIFWIKLSSIFFSLKIQHIEIWAKSFMFCRRCSKCILVRGHVCISIPISPTVTFRGQIDDIWDVNKGSGLDGDQATNHFHQTSPTYAF